MPSSKIHKDTFALVTGAASGIGYELARLLANDRYDLILVDLDCDELLAVKQQLEEQFEIKVIDICIDLAAPEAASRIFAEIGRLPVEILINNAGFGVKGNFASTDWNKELQMIQLHVVVLTELTKRMLGPMLQRGQGRILNVASIAGFYPGPMMAVYYASKAYIISFSEAITQELKESGITVTVLCPGPTKTGFQRVVGSEFSKLSRGNLLASPKSVAAYGYRSLLKGRTVAIPGIFNRLLVFIAPLFWRKLKMAVLARLQKINSAKGQ